MDALSEEKLATVHPDLAKVIRGAAQFPRAFIVYCGKREEAAQKEAVATHHSETLHTRHEPGKSGFPCAVDVYALDEHGNVDWADGHEAAVYGQIANQIKESADRLGIPLQWGGSEVGAWTPGVVSHYRDWGHFQLPWKEYP